MLSGIRRQSGVGWCFSRRHGERGLDSIHHRGHEGRSIREAPGWK